MLSYDIDKRSFTFNARTLAMQDEVRALDFRWDEQSKLWTCPNVDKAKALRKYADATAKLAFAGKEKDLLRHYLNSTAKDALIHIPKPQAQEHDYLPFQRAGIAYAMEREGTLIADEMGLGKTIQFIGILNLLWMKLKKPNMRVLIICPASLKLNWLKELRQWMFANLTYCVAHSDKPWPLSDVVICNYDILRKFHGQLTAITWDLIGVDEFHFLKNSATLRHRYFAGHKKPGQEHYIAPIKGTKRVALTGTPYPNKPIEAYTCLHWLDPESWPSEASMSRWSGKVVSDASLDELQTKLRQTVMVRRLKRDVLTELPPKVRQIIELPSGKLRELVEREKAEFKKREVVLLQIQEAMIAARDANDVAAYTEAVKSMRRAEMIIFTEMAKLRKEVSIAKLPYVIEHLRLALQSGKVVVFGHHHEVIETIHNAFPRNSVTCYGPDSMIKRQAAVELFQNNPDTTLIAGSFGPMGTGHTLTASSHVVIAELDWVPGVLLQAEDRCHRYPQNQCVLVQHLVLEDSLDVNMSQRAIEKQKAIELGLNLKTGTWEQNGTGASHSNGNGSALASAGNGAGNIEG